MKPIRFFLNAAATGFLAIVLLAPSASSARDEMCHPGEHRQMSQEQREQWAKNRIAKEATRLEIKASQQTAWDSYAAAKLELLSAFGAHKPLSPDVDAASATRQHADRAAAFAQKLSKLADATAKLQSVLSEEQRKVLDSVVRRHSMVHAGQFCEHERDGKRGHHHRRMVPPDSPPKSSSGAAAPAMPKN